MPATSGTNNVFLTDDVIAKEALRLLVNELVLARFVNRSYERMFGRVGDTISVKKPYRVKAASGRTLVVQPMVDQTTSLTVDQQKHVGLRFTINDRSLALPDFSDRYLKSAMVQLAHQVDLAIAREAVTTSFHAQGTPGTGTQFQTLIDARAKAILNAWPDDGQIRFLLNPLDAASHRKALTNLNNDALVKAAIERAYIGRVSNIDGFESAQIPAMVVGAHGGAPLTNGAGQTGSSLITDGWTASAAILKAGNIFTIADVYAVNPQTYESTGQLQQFVVLSDVTADGSGNATISISPAINDGTLTTTDADGNTVSLAAYQNVSAAPGDGKAITVLGTASTTYRQNLLLHKDAVTLAMVDLVRPQSAVVAKTVRDERSGVSMLMTAGYNINDFEETYRLDVLFGVKNIYPELSMRIFGSTS